MPSRIVACVLKKSPTAEDRININIALDILGVIILHFFQRKVRFKKVWCDLQVDVQVIAYELEEDIDKKAFMMYLDKLNFEDYVYIIGYKQRKLALEMGLLVDKFETLMVEIAKSDLDDVHLEDSDEIVRHLEDETVFDYVRAIINKENIIIEGKDA